MATESAVAPVAALASPAANQPASTPAPTPAPAATPAEAPKLTPAQLKAKAKEEKAARRAQAKEVKAATGVQAPAAPDAKGGKGKGKQDGSQAGQQAQKSLAHRPSVSGRRPSFHVVAEKDTRSVIPECFSHVPMAKRIPTAHAHKDVHPAVLAVGQQMAAFTLKDSIARLQATLLAFKKVCGAS